MDFKALLLTVIAGVPAGALEYWVLDNIPWYKNNPDQKLKRAVAYAAAALLGLIAWGIALVMGYLPRPEVFAGYVEQAMNVIIQVGLATFGVATAIHTRDLKTS